MLVVHAVVVIDMQTLETLAELRDVGILITVFERQLLGLFNSDPAVIEAGIGPLRINAWFYVIFLLSEIPLGCMRGMKRSTIPSLLNVIGICVPRIIWTFLVFPMHRSLTFLFVCFPISWIISAIFQWTYYFIIRRKLLKTEQVEA